MLNYSVSGKVMMLISISTFLELLVFLKTVSISKILSSVIRVRLLRHSQEPKHSPLVMPTGARS